MRTDTIFYQLFQIFPSLLFELISLSPQQADNYEFFSREIKELARRFDGIFLPTNENSDLPIYFVEVQFQPKSNFYWRFLAEIFVYLGQYQPTQDWIAVAVFASHNLDLSLPFQYRGLMLSEQIRYIYLDDLLNFPESSIAIGVVQLVVGSQQLAREKTKPLLERATRELTDKAFKQKVVELIERIIIYKFTNLTRAELEAMFSISDLKQTTFYQEAKQEGKLEGKQEGKLESIPGLLALGLNVEQIAQVLNLELVQVQQVVNSLSNN